MLLCLIREITTTIKLPILEKWASDFRLLRERDERTPEQVHAMLDWIFHAPESEGSGTLPVGEG